MSTSNKQLRVNKSVATAAADCPHCGTLLDSATSLKETRAKRAIQPTPEESVTVCLKCGEWSMFTATGLRKLTDDEYIKIAHIREANIARMAFLKLQDQRASGRIQAAIDRPHPKPNHVLGLHRKLPA